MFYDSDETEIRLSFYRAFSTFWNIFGDLCTQVFYSWTWVIKKPYNCNLNIKR